MDMNTAVSLLNLKEDLLDDEVETCEPTHIENETSKSGTNRKAKSPKRKAIKVEKNTFEKLIASVTKQLDCNANEISAWLNHIPNTPEAVQLSALRLITKHKLDPFADEIAIHQYEDCHWHAFITIDGWAQLINSHPEFNGVSFSESEELVNGLPVWMECIIYRKDRVVPVVVKEYLREIQTEHAIWKDMPRRMLRHRVIAQCARLAFGVSVPEYQAAKNIETPNSAKKKGVEISQKENLKHALSK